jgi:sugar (pentulose or hexulose) kinase
MGISAMMHGYLAFDKEDNQLAQFRTWRNTITEEAAAELTDLFGFNVPQRFSIAHLYQAILNKEEHVSKIAYLTTLSGYVHWKLTGLKVLGVGDASGMFPIDSDSINYQLSMVNQFNEILKARRLNFKLTDILPHVLNAGENAGKLTAEGARLLDPTGMLKPGISMCPPEGDAGTGMVATNSVSVYTGNVSAGTSVFAMLVLAKQLSKTYTEIDMVTTPDGKPVAMVHCNTCTSDLDAWVGMMGEAMSGAGFVFTKSQLYNLFYQKALEADKDCGGLINYNYYSGEPVTGVEGGRPLFVRRPDAKFTFANFARTQIYSTMATLKLGMDILSEKEGVCLKMLMGHGGLFKTPVVGQKLMAGALNVPVAVMDTAGEGGPWGMAILAAYMMYRAKGESLDTYLKEKVFTQAKVYIQQPAAEDIAGFDRFLAQYKSGLAVEKAAVIALK